MPRPIPRGLYIPIYKPRGIGAGHMNPNRAAVGVRTKHGLVAWMSALVQPKVNFKNFIESNIQIV